MALASGCAVNPATGRDDFVLMDEAAEQELGIRYNQDVQQRYPATRMRSSRPMSSRSGSGWPGTAIVLT